MKRIILLSIFLPLMFLAHVVQAQTPEAFNYQAVVRNASGLILQNQNVSFQLSILETSATGTAVYVETHSTTTNQFGLVDMQVGNGTPVSGSFIAIDWADDSHFLQVELDPNGGSSYSLMGSTQLVSVPYALHAKTVEFDMVDDADADSTNEIQLISKSGMTVTLGNGGGSFTDEVDDADADPNNEIQTISKSGSTVTLSNGGGTFTDEVDDADADPTNEYNTSLSMSGDSLHITDGGGTHSVDMSGLVDDGDWTRNGNFVYNTNDTIGIDMGANDDYNARLQIGYWFNSSLWMKDSLPNNVWIGGDINSSAQQDVVKLMIGGYDNDGYTVYPILARDENGNDDFYLLNRPTSSGDPFAYFAGNVGIGTETPTAELTLDGDADITGAVDVVGNVDIMGNEDITGDFDLTGDATITGDLDMTGNADVVGQIYVRDGSNAQKVRLRNNGGAGETRLFGDNGNLNVWITHLGSNRNLGAFSAMDASGSQSWSGAATTNGGQTWTYGPNGNLNMWITNHSSSGNHGWMAVYDANGSNQAGAYVNSSGQGVVFGDVKNFRMEHPTEQGKEIWYASLEGPEAGAYSRGTGSLVNGEATIQFDEHFELVANHTTMTVIVTPLDGSSKGLAVVEKTATGFKVVELLGGTGNYDFDWEVKAVRSGYENFRVIRDAKEMDTGTPPQLAAPGE